MGYYIFYTGDCVEKCSELDDNSVDLIITSPPYFNAKEYDKEDNNFGNNKSYQEYLEKIESILVELLRVTVPGGRVIWNTSPVLDSGDRVPIPFHTNQLFEDLGFIFEEDIVWEKPAGAAKLRAGGWAKNKGRPLTWHPNIVTEYIMVYKKPGKKEKTDKFDGIRTYYDPIPKDLWTNVWKFVPETNKHYHDAPFPEELVKRCILLYSFKGDVILDPFLGSGTTLKVARALERNGIGIELSPRYMEIAKENLDIKQLSLTEQHTYKFL